MKIFINKFLKKDVCKLQKKRRVVAPSYVATTLIVALVAKCRAISRKMSQPPLNVLKYFDVKCRNGDVKCRNIIPYH
jgi:hypothetical protein